MRRFCLMSNFGWFRHPSIRSWSQALTCGLRMCMNSTPTVRQYVSRSRAIRSRSVVYGGSDSVV